MAVTADADAHVRIVSYNMHGFLQGSPAVTDIISQHCPDVINLQEHWLTPYNLNKFDIFNDYFSFGCSAMSKTLETGVLRGRPFSGIMILIKKKLRNITETILCSERYAIVKVGNCVIANV